MTHQEAEVLVHAMLDGELDAGHARDLEAHLASCPRCNAQLTASRNLRQAIAEAAARMSLSSQFRRRANR